MKDESIKTPDIERFNKILSEMYKPTKWDKHKDFFPAKMTTDINEAFIYAKGKKLAEAYSIALLCEKHDVRLYKGEEKIDFQSIKDKSIKRSESINDYSRFYLETMEKFLGIKKGTIKPHMKYGEQEDQGFQIYIFVKWMGKLNYSFKKENYTSEIILNNSSLDSHEQTLAERKQKIRQEKNN